MRMSTDTSRWIINICMSMTRITSMPTALRILTPSHIHIGTDIPSWCIFIRIIRTSIIVTAIRAKGILDSSGYQPGANQFSLSLFVPPVQLEKHRSRPDQTLLSLCCGV